VFGRIGGLVCIVFVVAAGAASAASTDLMPNGSFENGLTGWSAFGGSGSAASDGVVGSSAAKFVASTARYGAFTDAWPVSSGTGGHVYASTAWFRSDSSGVSACLRVREWDSTGSTIVAAEDDCVTAAKTWQQVSVSYTLKTTGDRLEAYVFANGASGSTFEADGVTLVDNGGAGAPPPPPPPAPDTSITAGPGSSTTDTSASFSFASTTAGASFQCALDTAAFAACTSPTAYGGLAAGQHTFRVRAVDSAGTVDPTPASQTWTVQAPAPPPSSGDDAMQNGSFEGSLSGWTAFGGSAALATDGKVGANAAEVTATTSRAGLYTDYWPVSNAGAGAVYTSTAWFRSDRPGTTVCLRVREWDATGSTIVDLRESCATPTSAWTQATVSYTVQTAGDLLEAYVFQNGAAGTSFEVDAVTLAPGGAQSHDPVLAAAGDVHANCADSQAAATAAAASATGADVVVPVGDLTDDGSASQLSNCFGATWGAFGGRLRPAPGNHEYDTAGAGPYFSYFGNGAGSPGQGWYSYDLGAWHVVVLNSNCSQVGGCTASSPQVAWLQQDLAAHPAACTLAFFHHPLFTSVPEPYGNDASPVTLWQTLYDGGADVVVNAHTRSYERFAPQTPAGVADPARGIREFVVGTGGGSLDGARSAAAANSQAWQSQTFGVLRLALHATSYDWSFAPVSGGSYADSGSASCH
jgi:hypothetical protein